MTPERRRTLAIGLLILFGSIAIRETRSGLSGRERFVPPSLTAAGDIPYPIEVVASGLVTLSVNLTTAGQPPTVQVLRDIPGLTSVTSAIVTGWTYSPAMLDGNPTPSTINAEVVFDPSSTLNQTLQVTPVAPTPPPFPAGYLPPEVSVASYASSPVTSTGTGAVVLSVTIDKYGQIKKVDTIRDVPSLTPEAIATVKRWTINPAMFNGKAIPSKLIVAFVFRPHPL